LPDVSCRRLADNEKSVIDGEYRRPAGLLLPIRIKRRFIPDMTNISKVEALRIIHNCAMAYKTNLAHKNLMFITIKNKLPEHFEAKFLPLQLTQAELY
jgi:hypothetical protein